MTFFYCMTLSKRAACNLFSVPDEQPLPCRRKGEILETPEEKLNACGFGGTGDCVQSSGPLDVVGVADGLVPLG